MSRRGAAGSEVSEAIRSTLDGWLAAGRAKSAREINAGLCEDFASDVCQSLGREFTERHGVEDVCIAGFLAAGEDGIAIEAGPFDQALLRKHWPGVRPPDGLDWDDMARVSEDCHFDGGTHIWIAAGGRHYDAECPDGTENFFDLPFFVRVITSWREELQQAPAP